MEKKQCSAMYTPKTKTLSTPTQKGIRSILKVSLLALLFSLSFSNAFAQKPEETEKARYERMVKELEIEKQRLLEERQELDAIKNSPLRIREREMLFYGVFVLLIAVILILFLTRERKIRKGSREEIQKLQLVMKDLIDEVGKYLEKAPEAAGIGDLVLKAGNGVKNINTCIEMQKRPVETQAVDYDAVYGLFINGTDKITLSKRFNISPGEVDFIIKLKALKARDAR